MNPNDPQRSPTCADMVKSMDNGGNMHSAVDGTVPISNAPCSVVVSWLRVTKPGSRSLGRSFATCGGRDFRMSFFTTASQPVNVSRQV